MPKKMKIYVVHHSHTDIGYTERQEKIERYHVDFIKQAIDILNLIHQGRAPEWEGFRWTCENTWQVENFMNSASQVYINDFKKYVQSGEIDVSGNYLNMTELVDQAVLNQKLEEGLERTESLGYRPTSAMTADINGYAWGYAESLYQNGVENLFSCIHPHHGLFPLNQKQTPFYWESPEGNKVLVWVGEHYHLGNELGIVPNGGTSYTIRDELALNMHTEPFQVAEKRIYRYIENLMKEDYPFSFVPIMASGVISDNAPPNARIIEFIEAWNEKHQANIEIELVTLKQFFDVLRESNVDIPTYRGDWNDWWADGVGSTPLGVKQFREAQRKYRLSHKLDPQWKIDDNKKMAQYVDNSLRYAEHTWGYSTSVSEPWDSLVNSLQQRKAGYATKADEAISEHLDVILAENGEVSLIPDRPKKYKVINPHVEQVTDTATVFIGHWEKFDKMQLRDEELNTRLEVIDSATKEVLPYQIVPTASNGYHCEFVITLEAKEEKNVEIRLREKPDYYTIKNYAHIGAEGIQDIQPVDLEKRKHHVSPHNLETTYYKITLDETVGIKSIIDKSDHTELLRNDLEYAPFMGIYEQTEIKTTPTAERRVMGRNRKNISTKRYAASLSDIQLHETGDVYSLVELYYVLEGTKHYSVQLKVYHDLPKIAVTLKIHKDSYWEPENLYAPLPFTTGQEEQLYVEKTGCMVRPGIDQLPYTNQEFYLLQDGLAYVGQHKGVAIALPDVPLISMGSLKHHLMELSESENHEKNQEPVYSWIMNNFWETNFNVDLAGFYEFSYYIATSNRYNQAEEAINACRVLNEGLVAINISDDTTNIQQKGTILP
ncbi:glycoside hydrolase family 38 N-terminal domain-containing protein [Gracilibacillus timonensis]|uniref:glycoside hydrolase family 38 N-terminal domain-containing protein n=1 Tax=Gracilibacillus timonensis TaxID=1816696 RepID=UPI000B03D415|nr:glycosyl hydrolase [Gracilibacillus timonensis]